MTRVDFYLLEATEPVSTLVFACRLAEKAQRLGHQVFVHTESPGDAARLDQQMWTFRDRSFVPHALAGDTLAESDPVTRPVLIGSGEEPRCEPDLLINLAGAVPEFFGRFHRVAEILDADPERRQRGRLRFRFYRDRGYELNTHTIGKSGVRGR